MTNRGQASTEAMLILAAVILVVSTIQFRGEDMNETTNAIEAAKQGIQEAITKLSIQHGIEINIEDWETEGDNLIFHITVQGSLPQNVNLKEVVENTGQNHLNRTVGPEYEIIVRIEEWVSR